MIERLPDDYGCSGRAAIALSACGAVLAALGALMYWTLGPYPSLKTVSECALLSGLGLLVFVLGVVLHRHNG